MDSRLGTCVHDYGTDSRKITTVGETASHALIHAEAIGDPTQQATADAQTRIAKLESERDERGRFHSSLQGFDSRLSSQKGNSLTLNANEPFMVESID